MTSRNVSVTLRLARHVIFDDTLGADWLHKHNLCSRVITRMLLLLDTKFQCFIYFSDTESTLVCRNLSYNAAEADIRELFPSANNVSLMTDRDTGKSRG